ncbi:hypothetical protein B0T11DRAFT_90180 [Plectosphaerella cucumerina]|uniref:Zn(2)-C6 fungal-type domain-containing protein n=1 Tax=Plectosphaerella cucumerina TaxID=40658 RepID=A0A8K0X495_9PEZI|nr:hypothetical protein B0T11DRAFT_90180 [Plectosphaerella cucumerina]
MYGPAPERPRKTSIVRSRTGCKPCRRRRKKCDEVRPCCSRCRDNEEQCWYDDASFEFRNANQWAAIQVKKVRGDRLDIKSASTPSPHRHSSQSQTSSSSEPGILPVEESSISPASIETETALTPSLFTSESPTVWDSPIPDSALLGGASNEIQLRASGQLHKSFDPESDLFLHGPLTPGLSCHQLSSTDRRYLSHFVHHVVQIMPANQHTMLSLVSGSVPALQAAMAIGAASLANLQGKYSMNSPKLSDDDYSWTSNRCHKIHALDYAGRSLSTIAYAHHRSVAASGIGTLIATHIMLSLVELELGTFEGLRWYLNIADHLVFDNYKTLLESNQGRKVLRGVVNTRALQRFLAGPVGPVSRDLESPMGRFWLGVENEVSLGRHRVQTISYAVSSTLERLCLLTTMRHCRNSPTLLFRTVAKHLQQFTNSGHIFRNGIQASEADLEAACSDCVAEIRALSDEILCLPAPEGLPLPQATDDGCEMVANSYGENSWPSGDQIKPLRFGSHEEAMRAAEYVSCRLMCDASVVLSITNPSAGVEGEDSDGPATMILSAMPWLHLLVRIALGLDLSSCVNRNTYRRGICGMLLHSAIRCLSPDVCLLLEGLLDRLIVRGCTWEDTTFPSVLSVSTVRAVRSQLERGRIVLFLSTVKRDFDARFTIKAHRMTRTLLMHGWEAGGRDAFDENLPLDDFA